MAALSADRDTPRLNHTALRRFPVGAGKKIYAGSLVVLNAGNAEPGSTALSLVSVGRAKDLVDNTGGQAGDQTVDVERGIFRYANSAAADAITRSEIGSTVYIVDDQTVAKTNGGNTRSAAGKVFDIDALGVWVEIS